MVREILNTSGYFDPAEIEEWDEEVIVPFGTNHINRICIHVAREGWSMKAFYSFGKLASARGVPLSRIQEVNRRNGMPWKARVRKSVHGNAQDHQVNMQNVESNLNKDQTAER